MVRLATLVLISLALACQCPPEVERFNANKCRGRPGRPIALYWDMGQERYSHQLPGGTLDIEVIRSIADPIKDTVLVYLRIRNRLDYEVRFPLTGVSLHHDGDIVDRPVARDRDPRPNIGAGREKLFKWEFDVERDPVTGRFPLHIDDMYQWISGARGSELAGPVELTLAMSGSGKSVTDTERAERPAEVRRPPRDEPVDPEPVQGDEPEDDDRWDTGRPPR